VPYVRATHLLARPSARGSECGAGRMACDRGSGRAACDKAKVLAVAIASGAAAASALLSMPTDRSEPVVAILLASRARVGFSAAQRIPTFGRMSSRCRKCSQSKGLA